MTDSVIIIGSSDEEDVVEIDNENLLNKDDSKEEKKDNVITTSSTDKNIMSALPLSGHTNKRQIIIYPKRNEVLAYYNSAEDEFKVADWRLCLVEQRRESEHFDTLDYKVFDIKTHQLIKRTKIYNLALYEIPSKTDLVLGRRVIAKRHLRKLPHSEESLSMVIRKYSNFYPGFVIQSSSYDTKKRFLIIFDDGHVQYIRKEHVRIVLGEEPGVHAHPNSMNFLRYVLKTRKPEIQETEVGTLLTVELNGQFQKARVIEIDCGRLIKMKFQTVDRTEWLLNCSPRFTLVWRMFNQMKIKNNFDLSIEQVEISSSESEHEDQDLNRSEALQNTKVPRRKWIKPKFGEQRVLKYKPHTCSKQCVMEEMEPIRKIDGVEPTMLARPLLLGWNRIKKSSIKYYAPCNKPLKNIDAVYAFLVTTDSMLSIDCFTFDFNIDCLRACKTVNDSHYIKNQDISNGLEQFPIRVVNHRTNSEPESFEYILEYQLSKSVPKYFDNEFLSCCDCTDNCSDKSKCSCWQLTMDGLRYQNDDSQSSVEEVEKNGGYEYKRLEYPLKTGIFECNSKCKCSQTKCLNRVVQNPIDHRLELFRTKDCGWGVRTLTDIPKSAFVCCYHGELIDNKILGEEDDEYFAVLNFIETGSTFKEGFENFAPEMSDDETDLDDQEQPAKRKCIAKSAESTVSASKTPLAMTTERDSIILNFFPVCYKSNGLETVNKTRLFIEKKVTDYIIDGKRKGNIGRFINHSCDPNLFPQIVFVETHDLRFPRYAFFAMKEIKAGTELKWDYNYQIDSVEGRVIYCKCGAKECRKRLL